MIHLARHGETPDNVAPIRLMGRRDTPLSARGREQAHALARAAEGASIASLFTSPLGRARDTALVVADALGIEPVVDERLAESSRGSWEGRLTTDIAVEEPELWSGWQRPAPEFRFPGGESIAEHVARVAAALDDIAAAPQPALAVCHGGTIRCALLHASGLGTEHFHELRVPHATLIPLEPLGSTAAAEAPAEA